MIQERQTSGIRLTSRGHRVVGFAAVLGILLLMGFAGWIETLGM